MLTELCQELKNWFELEKHFGTFTIYGGQLTDVSFLQEGQYFRIIGSIFNDGVHIYDPNDAESLYDEVFEGAIWAMAVPPAVIALSDKIDEWQTKHGDKALSPYQSESFNGYSYTKGGGSSQGGSSGPTWRSTFASELGKWRKL